LGKLLGHLVSHRGIEANPDKIKAIDEIQVPRRVKDVQHLNGCITALGILSPGWASMLCPSSGY
jgi:hypothetical protein